MTIRTLTIAVAALAFLAGCSGTNRTPVPKTDAEKNNVAAEIATLMSDNEMIDQMFEGIKKQTLASVPNVCNAMPADRTETCRNNMASAGPIIQEVTSEMMDRTKVIMPELLKEFGAIIASEYTGEELAAMRDFYGSQEGKSILKKQPQVMTAYFGKVMARLQPMQIEMSQKIMQRLAEHFAAIPPT